MLRKFYLLMSWSLSSLLLDWNHHLPWIYAFGVKKPKGLVSEKTEKISTCYNIKPQTIIKHFYSIKSKNHKNKLKTNKNIKWNKKYKNEKKKLLWLLVIEINIQSKPIFFKIFFLLNLLAPTEVTFLRTFVETVGFFGN
jgi:hypothetical protein